MSCRRTLGNWRALNVNKAEQLIEQLIEATPEAMAAFTVLQKYWLSRRVKSWIPRLMINTPHVVNIQFDDGSETGIASSAEARDFITRHPL